MRARQNKGRITCNFALAACSTARSDAAVFPVSASWCASPSSAFMSAFSRCAFVACSRARI